MSGLKDVKFLILQSADEFIEQAPGQYDAMKKAVREAMSGQNLIDILQSIAIILLVIGNIRARNRGMTRAPMLITDDPFVRQELACPEARSSNTGPYREIYLYEDGSVVECDAGPRSQDDESIKETHDAHNS